MRNRTNCFLILIILISLFCWFQAVSFAQETISDEASSDEVLQSDMELSEDDSIEDYTQESIVDESEEESIEGTEEAFESVITTEDTAEENAEENISPALEEAVIDEEAYQQDIEIETDEEPVDITEVQQDYSQFSGMVITKLEYVKDYVTRPSFVRADIGLGEGDIFDAEDFDARIQRFLNLDLVHKLIYVVAEHENGVFITVYIYDKWHILPVIRYSETFITLFQIGAYDQNFLGMGHELLVNYIYRDGYHLFMAYYDVPRLPWANLSMTAKVYGFGWSDWYYSWDIEGFTEPTNAQLAALYDNDDGEFDANDQRTADTLRESWDIPYLALERISYGAYLNVDYELRQDMVKFGIQYSYQYEFIDWVVNAPWVLAQEAAGVSVDNKQMKRKFMRNQLSTVNFYMVLGNINIIDTFLREGHRGVFNVMITHKYLGSNVNIYRVFGTYSGHFLINRWINMAVRFMTAFSETNNYFIPEEFPVKNLYDFIFGGEIFADVVGGGYSTARAFKQTHFHDPNFYLVNYEFRVTILNEDNMPFFRDYLDFIKAWTLQVYVMLDFGNCWDGKVFDRAMIEDIYLSSGIGIYWVLKQISNFVVNPSFIYRFRPNPTYEIYFETKYFFK